jgi:hypothetical protein
MAARNDMTPKTLKDEPLLVVPTPGEIARFGEKTYDPNSDPVAQLLVHTGTRMGQAVDTVANKVFKQKK